MEVHILYSKKSQLQNLSAHKNPLYLLVHTQKKSVSNFASANVIHLLDRDQLSTLVAINSTEIMQIKRQISPPLPFIAAVSQPTSKLNY